MIRYIYRIDITIRNTFSITRLCFGILTGTHSHWVLLLLVNDFPNSLVPKAKSRDTNSIFYYYLYSVNVPNHLLIYDKYFSLLNHVPMGLSISPMQYSYTSKDN